MPNTFFMDVNANTAGFHNSGGSLTAPLIPTTGCLTLSTNGTSATYNGGTNIDDALNFGNTGVGSGGGGSTTAGVFTLNSDFNMGDLYTKNLTGSPVVNGLGGAGTTYLGQRITDPLVATGSGVSATFTIGNNLRTNTFTLNGNSIFIDPSFVTMAGILNISSADAPSGLTPVDASSTGINFAGPSTSGITGTINLNSGFLKFVNRTNSQTFLSTSATVDMKVAGYTVMVQRWASGLNTATVNGTFKGPGTLRIQGDVNSNIVNFTGDLTGVSGSFVMYLDNTVGTVSLPAAAGSYLAFYGSNVASTLTVSNVSSAAYIPSGIQFFSTGTGGRLNSSGAGFTVSSGIINSSSTAKTLILGGTATGNTISGNASIPGGGVLSLTKADTGSWELSGNNSAMTGAVALNANGGTLIANNATNPLGTGTVTMSTSTTIQLKGSNTLANALNLTGTLQNISGTSTVSGSVVVAAATTIQADAGSLTFTNATPVAMTSNPAITFAGAGNITFNNGIAASSGAVTKSGAGTVTVSGTSSFTGTYALSGGTLSLASLPASSSTVTLTGGILKYTGTGSVTLARPISLSGASSVTTGIDSSGNSPLYFTDTTAVSVGSGNTFLLTGSEASFNTLTAALSGAGDLSKTGAGKWIATSDSSGRSGNTSVTNGTLMAANANGTNKLFGSGTVTVDATSTGAKIQTGGSSAQKGKCKYTNLTFTGGASGRESRLRIGGVAESPTIYMAGDLTLPASGQTTFDLSNPLFSSPGTYRLVEFASGKGVVGGSITGKIATTGLAVGRSATYSYITASSPTRIEVTITIP